MAARVINGSVSNVALTVCGTDIVVGIVSYVAVECFRWKFVCGVNNWGLHIKGYPERSRSVTPSGKLS